MAQNLGTALSGLSKPGKAVAPVKKGKPTASMTIEPMPKTSFTDKTLAPPKISGKPSGSISPSPKAGPGWKAQSAIAHPGETTAPNATGLSKT